MRDLRLPALGVAAWAGGLLSSVAGGGAAWWAVVTLVGVTSMVVVGRVAAARPTVVAAAAVLLAVLAGGALRTAQTRHNPVAELARRGAVVDLVGVVTSDPRTVIEAHGHQELVRVQVRQITGRGATYRLRTSVVLLGDDRWGRAVLGSTVGASGRLVSADEADVAALFLARDGPRLRERPGPWWSASAAVRESVRDSVAERPADERAILPALVDGDESGVADDLADDFRTTGLTHLLAVSGTNLTLVVGFLLLLARWVGVRGRWLPVVGAVGTVGFVILARTEPSVVRAAAMGAVGLVAMGHNGRSRALRGLGAAVVVLMLVSPGLATSVGFALSVLATAGILLFGPAWRDALAGWMPRWLAEAIAVPAAAQLACTPLVAVISGQVSLVAVLANLLAEPAVGPATVLGLLGGLLGLIAPPLGRCIGWAASWCVAWIVAVARHTAALPTAAVGWGTGLAAIVVLVALTVATALYAPRVLRHRGVGALCCWGLIVVTVVRWPSPGWPPRDWVYVVCTIFRATTKVLQHLVLPSM